MTHENPYHPPANNGELNPEGPAVWKSFRIAISVASRAVMSYGMTYCSLIEFVKIDHWVLPRNCWAMATLIVLIYSFPLQKSKNPLQISPGQLAAAAACGLILTEFMVFFLSCELFLGAIRGGLLTTGLILWLWCVESLLAYLENAVAKTMDHPRSQ